MGTLQRSRLELEGVLALVLELPTRDRLEVFQTLRRFDGERLAYLPEDKLLEDRAASLVALTRAAEHLGCPPSDLTVQEFNRVAPVLELGWTAARVTRVWERWRFALEVAAGGTPRPTPGQLATLRRVSRGKRGHEDGLVALRLWRKTKPESDTMADYEAFRRVWNATLGEGELPLPSPRTVARRYACAWRDLVRVADGEIPLAQADRPGRKERRERTGPHDLIGLAELSQLGEWAYGRAIRESHKPGFPLPALTAGRSRLWVRSDVQAWLDGRPVPKRQRNFLQGEYLNRAEAASLLGLEPETLSSNYRTIPPPTVIAGGRRLWLRTELEQTLRDGRGKRAPGRPTNTSRRAEREKARARRLDKEAVKTPK